MKQTLVKGFKTIKVADLPTGIVILTSSMKDGTYRLAQDHTIPYDTYGSGLSRSNKANRTIKAGTIIVSTENGHYYRFNANGKGLTGLGKRNGNFEGAVAQRICITSMELGPCKATRKASKKKAKKKATRRR